MNYFDISTPPIISFQLSLSVSFYQGTLSLYVSFYLGTLSLSLSLSLYLSISHLFFNFFLVADKSEFRKGVLRPKRSKNCTFCNPHFSSLSFYSVFPFSHFPPLSSSLNENVIKKLQLIEDLQIGIHLFLKGAIPSLFFFIFVFPIHS